MTIEERELSIIYLEGIKENYIEGEGYERHPLPEYYAIEMAITALSPEHYEWCHDCKEYDQENHCCHRYSSFIRETLQDNIDAVLEDIKAEIETKAKEREFYLDAGHPHNGLYEALRIIDKHISGKE